LPSGVTDLAAPAGTLLRGVTEGVILRGVGEREVICGLMPWPAGGCTLPKSECMISHGIGAAGPQFVAASTLSTLRTTANTAATVKILPLILCIFQRILGPTTD
jgi:hypothetical protein